jgi:hypothetical protein
MSLIDRWLSKGSKKKEDLLIPESQDVKMVEVNDIDLASAGAGLRSGAANADDEQDQAQAAAAAPAAAPARKGTKRKTSSDAKSDDKDSESKDRKDKDKENERSKYVRGQKFQDSWFRDYPWLDKEKSSRLNAFVCAICTTDKQSNSFNESKGGAYKDNVRADKLALHEKSAGHIDAEKRVRKATSTNSELKSQPTLVQQLTSPEKAAIGVCARTLLWLATEEVAHSKYESLRNLLSDVGVNFGALAAGNASYTSDFFARQMLESLAWVTEQQHIEHIRSSPAVSVIIDESTDNANVKELCAYGRYTHKGEAKVAFLGIVDIPEGGAETVYKAVAKLLVDKSITNEQLLGFGSDGASPMTGPWLLPLPCVSHFIHVQVQ